MYRVQTKTVEELRHCYTDADDTAPQWTSTGGAAQYDTVPFDRLLQHYLNEHVPGTWSLVSVSVDGSSVRMVWRSDDR